MIMILASGAGGLFLNPELLTSLVFRSASLGLEYTTNVYKYPGTTKGYPLCETMPDNVHVVCTCIKIYTHNYMHYMCLYVYADVCVCACMYIYIYICICTYTYTYLPTYIHTCCVYTYVCYHTRVFLFVYMHTNIYSNAHLLMCMCICICIYYGSYI